MYRQILIHPDDQKYQRMLWIDQLQQLLTFQLTTFTTLTCAPFFSLRILLQLISDKDAKYPRTIPSLTKGCYVDDIFGGADNLEEAHLAATQLKQLCTAGGFELRK